MPRKPDTTPPPEIDVTISWTLDGEIAEKPEEIDGSMRHTMAILALEELSNILHIEMPTLANIVSLRAESFRAGMHQGLSGRLMRIEELVGKMLRAAPPPQVTPEGLILPSGVDHSEAG